MRDSFYGWYLKCQSDTQTLAVIPAVHQTRGKRTCSIQIITNNDVWTATFPASSFRQTERNIFIGDNKFGADGIRLSIYTTELTVKGKLNFGTLSPIKYDIMGPFALVPFLECRHSVWSMKHAVSGTMYINGRECSFRNACGYWEGDQGRSFPKEYLWTQCCFSHGSLMVSVADIPMAGIHFTGIIGIVLWKGREYRLATYLGARVVEMHNKRFKIVQGDMELEAWLLEETGRPLKAPTNGNMVRTIHENPACRAFYRFWKRRNLVFAFETNKASFEYEYLF